MYIIVADVPAQTSAEEPFTFDDIFDPAYRARSFSGQWIDGKLYCRCIEHPGYIRCIVLASANVQCERFAENNAKSRATAAV